MQFKEQQKKKAVTFSYDDGVTQDIRLIELLNKYGLKCTFNLNSNRLGDRGMLIQSQGRIARYRVHPGDVRTVYEGHEVAVHTLDHPVLTKLKDDGDVIRQVEQDRLNLSDLVGYEVIGMAYPGGGVNSDERVAALIKNHTGVQYARTTICTEGFVAQTNLYQFRPTAFHLNFNKMMQLGRSFVETEAKTPQILCIWGHSYEMDYATDNWHRLEEFFALISGRDDVFYGTNKEVLL